jgi:putative transposase
LHINPAAPWESGYAESFNSTVRDELLNVEEFGSLAAARVLAQTWREEYNHVRAHSALGCRTPAEFAAMLPKEPRSRCASR